MTDTTRRRWMRGSALVLALVLVGAAPTPPTAPTPAGTEDLPAAVLAAERTVDEVRAAMAEGTFSARVAGLLAIDDRLPEAVPQATVTTEALATVATLPAELQAPVAELTAAVTAATDHLGTITGAELAEAVESGTTVVATTHSDSGQAPTHDVEASAPSAEVEDARRRTAEAATVIAAALDAQLPALQAAAADATGAAVEGCDLLDALPVLCVGSEADNTYTADAALLIDLGGADTYNNTAGGAPFELPGSPHDDVMSPVSVNLDLSGDDTYAIDEFNATARFTHTPASTNLTGLVGQGAAWFHAVGILADLDGDDTYTVTPPPPGDGGEGCLLSCSGGRILAQGTADNGGFGLLVDGAGDDAYSVSLPEGPGSYSGNSRAQGAAVAATGSLVDHGAGTDTYVIDVGHATGGARMFSGQGTAAHGSGVLFDGGGADAFRIEAAASSGDVPVNTALDSSTAVCPSSGGAAGFCVAGQGSASTAGTGLLLTGDGPTSYELRGHDADASGYHRLDGQAAANGGLAILDDLGGDDSYVVESTLTGTQDVTIDDDTPHRARHFLDASTTTASSFVQAQAAVLFGGTAVVSDRGDGDDTYLTDVRQAFTATVHDLRTAADGAAAVELIGYGVPRVNSQAGGGTQALLRNEGGSDTYIATATNDANVTTGASSVGQVPQVSAVALGRPDLSGQGSGGGATALGGRLMDLGGTQDTFTVSATNRATAPDPDRAYATATVAPELHGADGGTLTALATDVDVLTVPARPVCPEMSDPGIRGFGQWTDKCPRDPTMVIPTGALPSVRYAGGYVPGAIGQTTSLVFTDDTPTSGPINARIPVSAQLTDANGDPLPEARVTFELRSWPGGLYGYGIWQVDATTDADGVARALLPTRIHIPPFQSFDPAEPAEVRATYHGDPAQPDRHPSHATTPLSLGH